MPEGLQEFTFGFQHGIHETYPRPTLNNLYQRGYDAGREEHAVHDMMDFLSGQKETHEVSEKTILDYFFKSQQKNRENVLIDLLTKENSNATTS